MQSEWIGAACVAACAVLGFLSRVMWGKAAVDGKTASLVRAVALGVLASLAWYVAHLMA